MSNADQEPGPDLPAIDLALGPRKPDGGQAFPMPNGTWNSNRGMSLRDHFAGQALVAHGAIRGAILAVQLVALEDGTDIAADIARRCYRIADAMLAERDKRAEPTT